MTDCLLCYNINTACCCTASRPDSTESREVRRPSGRALASQSTFTAVPLVASVLPRPGITMSHKYQLTRNQHQELEHFTTVMTIKKSEKQNLTVRLCRVTTKVVKIQNNSKWLLYSALLVIAQTATLERFGDEVFLPSTLPTRHGTV